MPYKDALLLKRWETETAPLGPFKPLLNARNAFLLVYASERIVYVCERMCVCVCVDAQTDEPDWCLYSISTLNTCVYRFDSHSFYTVYALKALLSLHCIISRYFCPRLLLWQTCVCFYYMILTFACLLNVFQTFIIQNNIMKTIWIEFNSNLAAPIYFSKCHRF